MFADMMRAIELHRLTPTVELAAERFDGAADVIRALTKGNHFGKICMRAWD
jgi:hypothetical protein